MLFGRCRRSKRTGLAPQVGGVRNFIFRRVEELLFRELYLSWKEPFRILCG